MIVNRPKKKKKTSRYRVYFFIMGVVFTAIIVRLSYIQIYKHEDYLEAADSTAVKTISQIAPRGNIYDQKGNLLSTNTQTYVVKYTSTSEADKKIYSTIDKLSEILEKSGSSIDDDFQIRFDENGNEYFDYTSKSDSAKEVEKLRFLKDRNFNVDIEKDIFGDKYKEDIDLTDEEQAEVDRRLLEIQPDKVFCNLVKNYKLISLINPNPTEDEKKKYADMSGEEITEILLKSYTKEQLRKYIVIKDAIKMASYSGNDYVNLVSTLPKETAFIIMEQLNSLPGVSVTTEPIRFYPYKTLASSVLGYLTSIDDSNENVYKLKGYDTSTDLVGAAGIESSFEDELRGTKGGTTVKVDSSGNVTSTLFQLESYPGNDVHLTIDKNIQYVAEKSLEDSLTDLRTTQGYPGATRGAVVAVEVDTGRILASVSNPYYDPNDFVTGKLTDEKTKEYFAPDYESFGNNLIRSLNLAKTVDDLFPISDGVRTDPNDLYPKAFYNYATLGLIPPGSTFKPMTSIAGLQAGVITPDEMINDTGVFNIHPEVYGSQFDPKCLIYSNYGYGHGPINLTTALSVSCNFYFYEVAYKLFMQGGRNIDALDSLAKYAWRFGLGCNPKESASKATTGIELAENFGQVYNFESYKNNTITSAKFQLRDYLEAGNYNGTTFVPLDYSINEDDPEKLAEAKANVKNVITETFKKVGTDEQMRSQNEFKSLIIDYIKDIMENSDVYKKNVENYELANKCTVNIECQANTVANIISQYVISDMGSQITSPAQEVYAAIGQGMNTFTPMQLAQYVSTLANGGTRYKLHYVDKVTDSDGNIIEEYQPEVLDKVDLDPKNLEAVIKGMTAVNNSEDGTAQAVFANFPIVTAGKTGTADFQANQKEIGRNPYATYISFAPADDPKIAVVAVAYDGGHGGNISQIAKAIYEQYFKEELQQKYPDYVASSSTFQKYVANTPEDIKNSK